MKKEYLIINAYIKNACKNVHSRHIKREIKDELFSHLMEHYERQITLGKSDEEAQKIAVSYMGDSKTVSKTFERLYKGSEKLISETVGSLFLGIVWSVIRTNLGNFQIIYLGMGFALQFVALYLLRKINNKFKTASIIVFSNLIFTVVGSILYDYFSLPLEFKYFVFIASGLVACITYAFIFAGLREVEKPTKGNTKSEIYPVISTILMIITQAISSVMVFFESDYNFLLLLVLFVTGCFPMAMLIGHGTDILESIDWNVFATYAEDKKIRGILVIALALVLFISPIAVVNRPAKTVDFAIQDISTEASVTEIKENMLSLGLPESVANELPDSEILKYKGAEQMQINEEDDYWATDLTYKAYAFSLPETDSQPERVRILVVISGFDVYEKLYRNGIYINTEIASTSEFEYDLSAYDGTFMKILCDINNETREIVPFYKKDLNSAQDFKYPIGCEYGYPKGSKNHRVYAAQTVIPSTDEKSISINYSYYYYDNALSYENTVAEHSRSSFSSRDFIDADFHNSKYIEPPVPDEFDYEDVTSYEWIDELLFENT